MVCYVISLHSGCYAQSTSQKSRRFFLEMSQNLLKLLVGIMSIVLLEANKIYLEDENVTSWTDRARFRFA